MNRYNELKTTQAATRFIRAEGGRISYMKLLKLLYLADRAGLARRGRTLTGDRQVAMKNGPLGSRTYELIRQHGGDRKTNPWAVHIDKEGEYDVRLKADPGDGELSDAEIAVIVQLSVEHRDHDQFQMADWCHLHCPEWKAAWETRPNDRSGVPTGRNFIEDNRMAEAVGLDPADFRMADEEVSELELVHCALVTG